MLSSILNKRFFILWLKYVLATTVLFVVAGFILKVAVEGMTAQQALDLLLEIGLYQSILYAMVVATLLTIHKN